MHWAWRTDADAQMLMHWCWCTDVDALMLMQWRWCTDVDALMLMQIIQGRIFGNYWKEGRLSFLIQFFCCKFGKFTWISAYLQKIAMRNSETSGRRIRSHLSHIDLLTILTLGFSHNLDRCYLSWRWWILQLKEIEFVLELFNFESSWLEWRYHHRHKVVKMLSGFSEWKSSFLRKFPSFEWPRQTRVWPWVIYSNLYLKDFCSKE